MAHNCLGENNIVEKIFWEVHFCAVILTMGVTIMYRKKLPSGCNCNYCHIVLCLVVSWAMQIFHAHKWAG